MTWTNISGGLELNFDTSENYIIFNAIYNSLDYLLQISGIANKKWSATVHLQGINVKILKTLSNYGNKLPDN